MNSELIPVTMSTMAKATTASVPSNWEMMASLIKEAMVSAQALKVKGMARRRMCMVSLSYFMTVQRKDFLLRR